MDSARFERADAILDKALDLPAAKRAAFLDEECDGDEELRSLVDRLLGHVDRDPGFLSPGATTADMIDEALDDDVAGRCDLTGRSIGSYRIEREIGRGGMAAVYLAERADGQFEQKVALKIVYGSVRSDEAIQRFSRERQILAAMVHPHIARLFDGGITPENEPYFVMEYVEGLPIDRFCDARRLSIEERLRLFLQVASAVGYAHRNLVIHRDIKPGNILVSADGDAKLLDFGIAKPIGEMDGEGTVTRQGIRPMTPAFAAPEQIRTGLVTTAVDIYQLGILLYLMLCGRMPYAVSVGGFAALQRAILEQAPEPPSATLGAGGAVRSGAGPDDAIARARATTPAQLKRILGGDLDNIVLKALRKEPERRYSSVSQLMDDVENYLAGRTVGARPDTLGYRTSKFVRRHRVAVALAMTSLWLLVAFALNMTVQAGRIARERDRANREAESARQVADLLVDIFAVSDPQASRPDDPRGAGLTAREVLDRGTERVMSELGDQPQIRAELLDTLGRVYQNLGILDSALPLLQEALETRRRTLGPRHPDTILTLNNLSTLLEAKGDYDAAESLHREALDALREIHGARHSLVAGALNDLGLLSYRVGKYDEARSLFQQAIEIFEENGKEESLEIADVWANLGVLMQQQGDLDAAEQLHLRSLQTYRAAFGENHPSVAITLDNLGRIQNERGDLDEAERLARKGLAVRRRILDEQHPDISASINNLAVVLYRKGDLEGALDMFIQIAERDRDLLGESHPDYGTSLNNIANMHLKLDDFAAAEPYFREALAVFRSALPPDHHLIGLGHSNLGNCLQELRRWDEAERELLVAYKLQSAALGEDHNSTLNTAGRLERLYSNTGREVEAARFHRDPE